MNIHEYSIVLYTSCLIYILLDIVIVVSRTLVVLRTMVLMIPYPMGMGPDKCCGFNCFESWWRVEIAGMEGNVYLSLLWRQETGRKNGEFWNRLNSNLNSLYLSFIYKVHLIATTIWFQHRHHTPPSVALSTLDTSNLFIPIHITTTKVFMKFVQWIMKLILKFSYLYSILTECLMSSE